MTLYNKVSLQIHQVTEAAFNQGIQWFASNTPSNT